MSTVVYRIKDVALRLGRNPFTIKRWEERGFLKAARRDSRGWRIYSEQEVHAILDLVRSTGYFKQDKNYRSKE